MKSSAFVLVFIILALNTGFSQDEADIVFKDSVDPVDTITIAPQPIEGYKQMLKRFHNLISETDTLGNKYELKLYPIRCIVNAKGEVDSIFMINHLTCSIHRKIARELKKTKWTIARDKGKPVDSYVIELRGSLYFNKRVYKKYDCWPSLAARLLSPWL